MSSISESGPRQAKHALRQRFMQQLKDQTQEERTHKSHSVHQRVYASAAYQKAKEIFCYVSLPYEVQTLELITHMLQQHKRVIIPAMAAKAGLLDLFYISDVHTQLQQGRFGVWEPKRAHCQPALVAVIELAIIPGLAFDAQGNRLGHGKGYFDRFLEQLPLSAQRMGLAYRLQIVDALPKQAHDRAVQQVITE